MTSRDLTSGLEYDTTRASTSYVNECKNLAIKGGVPQTAVLQFIVQHATVGWLVGV